MGILEKIEKDLNEAAKAGETKIVSCLRLLKAALKNAEIAQKKKALKEEEIIVIVRKEIKRHQDSIEAFKKGERDDLVKKETFELKLLEKYLPPALDREKIKEVVRKIIAEEPEKNFDKIMGRAMGELKGQAEGKEVSEVVKELLSQ